jgi:putative membrane protein
MGEGDPHTGFTQAMEAHVLAVVRMFALPRALAGLLIAALALILFDPRPALAVEPGVPDPPSNLITDTGEGQVSAADKDFVIRVRLAGLWEIPAGEMTQDKSKSNRVKGIGADIAEQHRALDQLARAAAKKLKIQLPNVPNEAQQGWLKEMEDAEVGQDFDQIFIDRLRAAHGSIFPAVATIRGTTRNDTVRKLAQRTNQFVMTHMTLLESSGIVDFQALPTAPAPNAAPAKSAEAANPVLSASDTTTSSTPSVSLPVVGVIVLVALVGGLLATRTMMNKDPRRRYRQRRESGGYGY